MYRIRRITDTQIPVTVRKFAGTLCHFIIILGFLNERHIPCRTVTYYHELVMMFMRIIGMTDADDTRSSVAVNSSCEQLSLRVMIAQQRQTR